AALNIIMTIRKQRNQTDLHWMLLVDQAKAFDQSRKRHKAEGPSFFPIIYNSFEPLLKQLENKIVEIPLGRQKFKLVAYANDLSIG
ncbi:21387_t:CDS:2, partial [Gigaspora rosea]